jgi:hypothetical protein
MEPPRKGTSPPRAPPPGWGEEHTFLPSRTTRGVGTSERLVPCTRSGVIVRFRSFGRVRAGEWFFSSPGRGGGDDPCSDDPACRRSVMSFRLLTSNTHSLTHFISGKHVGSAAIVSVRFLHRLHITYVELKRTPGSDSPPGTGDSSRLDKKVRARGSPPCRPVNASRPGGPTWSAIVR